MVFLYMFSNSRRRNIDQAPVNVKLIYFKHFIALDESIYVSLVSFPFLLNIHFSYFGLSCVSLLWQTSAS